LASRIGDEKVITVSFPADYQAAHLAGKEATFDIKVKAIAAPGELEINDELAKTLGLDSADKLREIVRSQIEEPVRPGDPAEAEAADPRSARQCAQVRIALEAVDAEFESIWRQINQELSDNGKTFDDEGTTEEAAREEYRKLAERRVRLGLVLSKIGEDAGVQVSDEELQRSLFEQVRKFPGQEQEIYEYFQKTPGAVASLRAPIFEEKTIDHLMTVIDVTDKTVTKEELMADDEAEAEEKPAAEEKGPAKKKGRQEGRRSRRIRLFHLEPN
jgi:trigger factor